MWYTSALLTAHDKMNVVCLSSCMWLNVAEDPTKHRAKKTKSMSNLTQKRLFSAGFQAFSLVDHLPVPHFKASQTYSQCTVYSRGSGIRTFNRPLGRMFLGFWDISHWASRTTCTIYGIVSKLVYTQNLVLNISVLGVIILIHSLTDHCETKMFLTFHAKKIRYEKYGHQQCRQSGCNNPQSSCVSSPSKHTDKLRNTKLHPSFASVTKVWVTKYKVNKQNLSSTRRPMWPVQQQGHNLV